MPQVIDRPDTKVESPSSVDLKMRPEAEQIERRAPGTGRPTAIVRWLGWLAALALVVAGGYWMVNATSDNAIEGIGTAESSIPRDELPGGHLMRMPITDDVGTAELSIPLDELPGGHLMRMPITDGVGTSESSDQGG